ncbi:nuclear pore complex protein NUP96 [Iris pallida]|uniref:Nuclear pore complex protein NUP96 n=1 Tax=Iris pallida TaxID=29817 RepID=A0AAX6DT28_IRIPA|nr:nuclear pore complex protein NUP96 [Iris pallida]
MSSSPHLLLPDPPRIPSSPPGTLGPPTGPRLKKLKPSSNDDDENFLPVLNYSGYFTSPSVAELARAESVDRGFCGRVPNFVIGRLGYGHIRFIDDTDVRFLNLDRLVKFGRHSVSVYGDESDKPPIGRGLNKPAEVTLLVQLDSESEPEPERVADKLRACTEKQGAEFVSYDPLTREWKFVVLHFSRFGLGDEEEEDDTVMDDVAARLDISPVGPDEVSLSHSLPAHLGLDPVKMHEMRMLMFPADEEDDEFEDSFPSDRRRVSGRGFVRADSPATSGKSPMLISPMQGSSQKKSSMISPSPLRKVPVPLLEYNMNSSGSNPCRSILMIGQNKGLPVRAKKIEGFKLEDKHETPLSGNSHNLVDAALFMGRSFRVGWGPNGVLVHTGTPVGKSGNVLSSVINIEKVAIDRTVRDGNGKVKEELVDLGFASPLDLHKSLDSETIEVGAGSFRIKLQKVIISRTTLSEICRAYIGVIEKKLEVSNLSTYYRLLLMHQVTIWELIKVLFSERETGGNLQAESDDYGEDMMLDKRDVPADIDPEASPFIRRAEFSDWLQDTVCHRVQEEVSCLNDSSDLEHMLIRLTGRQLDTAVELAASRGDVRLSILLSQAGGSMVNRDDMARQLNLWRVNGLDFNYIENDRLKLYELLAGNIQGALQDSTVDWKRYLGLVMWYQLPPDTSLPFIIHTYQQLLGEGRAPNPVPVYVDEGPVEDTVDWRLGDRYDIAYYLMLLHANQGKAFDLLKTMFSAFSSTHDPLDHHMIWHQCAVLEAIGAFSSDDLNVLHMSYVSQLLCLGQCHWAIYVVMHMPYHEDFPHIHSNLIREILSQYCEIWSAHDIQRQFIEDLGVPSEWMHEALAIYSQYYGNLPKALEHFLECCNWQKAHSIFMTSVAHSLFLSSKHPEIWRITTLMEEYKSEIADWDLGAGIYFDFYNIRSLLQDEDIMDDKEDPLEKKNEACKDFFVRLNDSLAIWGNKFPVDARAAYSKMAEELGALLESTPGESSTSLVQMNCFETMLSAPIPEDLRSCRLQDALSVFTYLLTEHAS